MLLMAASAVITVAAYAQQAASGDTYMAAGMATEDLNGTARYVGMGGAMEALGADMSVIGTNPAGIGMFRKNQFAGGLSVISQSDGKSFGDGSKTNASLDQMGIVFSTRSGKHSFLNFAFNYHKSRNFNYVLSAANALNGSAQNSQTVFKDMNGLIPSNFSLPYSQLDALYINNMNTKEGVHDPVTGQTNIVSTSGIVDYAFDRYEFDRAHTGYIGEYDFNISGNINNRVYLGLTVGIDAVHYKGYSEYYETLNDDNFRRDYFRDVLISDNQKITGYGYNVKAGIIFRPLAESAFRIGAAIATPTFYKLTLDNYTTIGTNVDESSANEDFRFNTPWKFNLSVGHTIGNKLALGAVYEYADYSTCDMRTIDSYNYEFQAEESSSDPAMKRHIQKSLNGVSTLKLGAELKPDKNISLRAGYNYVSSAYKSSAVRDQTLMSPGVYYASTTDYTNWGDTHRFTAGIGFNIEKVRLDFAYQYQTRNGDFYPFMKDYSASYYETDANGNETGNIITLHNSCEPVKVKDNRHQLLATFTYTF